MTDKQARLEIAQTLNKNYFVEASAGSGKTTSLVYRMVALVESGVPIEKICTITFTKAAADEFFARFQKLLSIRSTDTSDDADEFLPVKTEMTKQKCAMALANIDLCSLGTIDAFLNTIAHEMPSEIGVPSDVEIAPKEERQLIMKKFFEKILSDDTHPLNKYALMFYDLTWPQYDCFARGIEIAIDNRQCEIDYDASLLSVDFDQYFVNEKNDFLSIIDDIVESHLDFGTGTPTDITRGKLINKLEITYDQIKNASWNDCLPKIKYLIEKILYSKELKGSWNAKVVAGTRADGPLYQKTLKSGFTYTDVTKNVFDSILSKLGNYLHSLILYLSIEAEKEIRERMKALGKFDYSDFLYFVTQAFRESALGNRELVDHIYERHSYFLLDENQDTSPMQTELFFYIAATNKNPDWRKMEPKEGSIFIVGDPKQSIYAFRGANVNAYRKLRDVFERKGEVLELQKNFRSNTTLKDWFNKAMDPILNHGLDSLKHNEIPLNDDVFETENQEDANDIILDAEHIYTMDDANSDPSLVAKLIRTLHDDHRYKIICKNKGYKERNEKPYKYRTINYSDFLLVPKSTRVMNYVDIFKEYQIPLIIEAQIPFDNAESLMVLIDLVTLMKEPQKRANLIKVLTGELYLFDDSDLVALYNDDYNFDIADIKNINVKEPRLLDAILELNRLYEKCKDLSFTSTLLTIINDLEFKLLKRVSAEYLEYTYFVIEKIREQENAGNLSGIGQLKSFLERFLKPKKDDNRVLRFKDKIDRVKMSNLHKVKGLQAPIVILIKPRAQVNEATEYIDYSFNPPKTYFKDISRKDNNDNTIVIARTNKYPQTELDKWQKFANAEDDRLQYVAATRAESVLLVSKYTKSDQYINAWQKLLDRIDPNKTISIPDVQPSSLIPDDIKYNALDIDKKCNDASIKYHSPSDVANDYRVKKADNNEDVIVDTAHNNDTATMIGTIVHRFMECLVSSRDGYEDKYRLVDSVINEYHADECRDMLMKVADTIYAGGFAQKNSSVEQDIYKKLMNAKQALCEVPFSYMDNDVITYGIIDLLYEDDSGYHIIDYKTNKESDVAKLEQHYKSQLEDYVKALKQQGIDADAHIYHIDIA